MIQIDRHGPVRKFRLARSFGKRGLYFTTAYWVDGLLIDTGCRHTVPELMQALETLPVGMIVNTHSHEDHIAGNAPLQAERKVTILAHPLALPVLADPRGKQPLNAYRKVMWGTPDPSRGKPLGEKVPTEHYTFMVIPTPGHSPDHVCLFEPEQGWLFTGDAYVGGREKALRVDYDIWGILGSLKKLAQYPVRRLFPGSGTVRENPLPEMPKKNRLPGRTGGEGADPPPAGDAYPPDSPPPVGPGGPDDLSDLRPFQRVWADPVLYRQSALKAAAEDIDHPLQG